MSRKTARFTQAVPRAATPPVNPAPAVAIRLIGCAHALDVGTHSDALDDFHMRMLAIAVSRELEMLP